MEDTNEDMESQTTVCSHCVSIVNKVTEEFLDSSTNAVMLAFTLTTHILNTSTHLSRGTYIPAATAGIMHKFSNQIQYTYRKKKEDVEER